VVTGRGNDGHLYVLAACSIRGTSDQWGRAPVTTYYAWSADRLCADVGGSHAPHLTIPDKEGGMIITFRFRGWTQLLGTA
jgi:hypothetical protein